jgi:TorA maturation chaperone TorD
MWHPFRATSHDRPDEREACRPLDVRQPAAVAALADVPHMPHTRRPYFRRDWVMKPKTKITGGPAWFTSYARIRTESYVMLASLMGHPPSENLLKVLQNLQWDERIPEGLDRSLGTLRQASHDYPLSTLKDEYNKLFVGLGCGELVPYASWYREKKIQSSPLASLRSDLIHLGIVRQEDNHDSEDHAAALCECMALISQKPNKIDRATQAKFFQQHVAPWMTTFFEDIASAKSAQFYRAVGIFGRHFLEAEIEYLKQG